MKILIRKYYYPYHKNFKISFLWTMLETMQARAMIVWGEWPKWVKAL